MYSDLKERVIELLDNANPEIPKEDGFGKALMEIINRYDQIHKGCISWCAEDVITRAIDTGMYKIPSEDEAWEIVEKMIDEMDCNYGVTWDTIDNYLTPLSDADNPDAWTNEELWAYLIGTSTIHPDEKFSEWEQDRPRMVELVKEQRKEQ